MSGCDIRVDACKRVSDSCGRSEEMSFALRHSAHQVGQDMVYDPTMERATQAREAPRRTVSREGTAPRKKRAANADDSATNARKKTSTLGGGTEARQRSGAKRRVSKSDEVQ